MNPDLSSLQPYPFQRLRALCADIKPNPNYAPLDLSIGEPKHPTPSLIKDALVAHLHGLASYPSTRGMPVLRQAIAEWLTQRYAIPLLDIEREILPVNGSREALFSFAQAVIDRTKPQAIVISPNPFYQIYEGAALLAGAKPYFLNTLPDDNYRMAFEQVPSNVWHATQLVYVCTPANPSGTVMSLSDWQNLFDLQARYGFILAVDECYSEIYSDEAKPPLGALQAAHQLGRDYHHLVIFSSLSKRSNVPGMRSGFVAGDANILDAYASYRTYHGCAMNPTVQYASMLAWQDETHVQDNRRLYREKMQALHAMLNPVLPVTLPPATFYLWLKVPEDDTVFAQRLYADYHLTVLPGSFLARQAHGINPGAGFVRLALVADLKDCLQAGERIKQAVNDVKSLR